MPGVDIRDENGCGPTHHHACCCREKYFKELEQEVKSLRTELGFATERGNLLVRTRKKLEKALFHLNWIEVETRDQTSPGSAKRVNAVAREALKELS